MLVKGLDDLGENSLGDLGANLDGVVAVSENLRFNNGSKTILLADGSIAGKGVSSLKDGQLRWAAVSDLEHSSPLSESGTCSVVLFASVCETIKSGSSILILGSRKDHKTLVDLDAGNDSLLLEELSEGGAISSLLEEGLLEEDHT